MACSDILDYAPWFTPLLILMRVIKSSNSGASTGHAHHPVLSAEGVSPQEDETIVILLQVPNDELIV